MNNAFFSPDNAKKIILLFAYSTLFFEIYGLSNQSAGQTKDDSLPSRIQKHQ
jgi:hypothetical protein